VQFHGGRRRPEGTSSRASRRRRSWVGGAHHTEIGAIDSLAHVDGNSLRCLGAPPGRRGGCGRGDHGHREVVEPASARRSPGRDVGRKCLTTRRVPDPSGLRRRGGLRVKIGRVRSSSHHVEEQEIPPVEGVVLLLWVNISRLGSSFLGVSSLGTQTDQDTWRNTRLDGRRPDAGVRTRRVRRSCMARAGASPGASRARRRKRGG